LESKKPCDKEDYPAGLVATLAIMIALSAGGSCVAAKKVMDIRRELEDGPSPKTNASNFSS